MSDYKPVWHPGRGEFVMRKPTHPARARSHTRMRGLTVVLRGPDGPEIIARPTSLHGAAVACRRSGADLEDLTVCLQGEPISEELKDRLPPEWRRLVP